jgi:FKBP-type peptidyl-prolyl cis-trans isomerase FklB
MRFPLFSLIATPILLASLATAQASDLNADTMTQSQKYSYVQGYDLAQKLEQSDLVLDTDVFVQAIRDGFSGKASLLSPEQTQAVMDEEKRVMMVETEAKAKANEAKGKAFLAENKKREEVKELLSGVQYEVLKAGEGKAVAAEDTITIHYEGTLLDGTVFDSSYTRGNPATFAVNQVVPGFSDALQNMKEGDIWRVVIPAHLAYGQQGAGKKIGPNETLVFKIELIKVN